MKGNLYQLKIGLTQQQYDALLREAQRRGVPVSMSAVVRSWCDSLRANDQKPKSKEPTP